MLFAALDAAGWVVVLGAGFVGLTGTLTSVASLVIAYLERQKAADREIARIERERLAAAKVDAVKTTLETATQEHRADIAEQKAMIGEVAETGMLTHDLVNSASLINLQLYAELAERMASSESARPEDRDIATKARQAFETHEKKQKEAMEASTARKATEGKAPDPVRSSLAQAIKDVPKKTIDELEKRQDEKVP